MRRAIPRVDIEYVSATSTGLFEQANDRYGEIWYELDGRRQISRVTTAEGVLDAVFAVANVTAPPQSEDEIFRGHPLAARPRGAAAVFYVAWPLVVMAIGLFTQGRKA